MKVFTAICLILCLTVACSKEPAITEDMLDGGTLFDPSLYQPEKYLVSRAIPTPTPAQANTPVIIACHGYTATTFEWDEFRTWLGNRTDVYLSQVLLGGHGRTYEEFKKSTWRDWQEAITAEYERLEKAGYKNISLLGSSTSGPLLLELVSSGYFTRHLPPRNFILVDPIVIPSDKTLSLVPLLGPMLGYIDTKQSAQEDKVYYHFRPQETLQQLQKLLTLVRRDLEKGISLPAGSRLTVYKAKQDPAADPISAVLIYKGVKLSTGGPPDVQLIDSDRHVFTRLQFVEGVTEKDYKTQKDTFAAILAQALAP
ncbi:hypothetical protein GCM10023189_21120 [Nibrella saemangeumensis]|uniref:Carboxylesterase n=1 Tax=Nibrella saemangeumensis TaxID=1084526 RepID=A0ABP8MUE9_9BACT